jgi:hypothetical protein
MAKENDSRPPSAGDREGARKNAQNHFAASEQRNKQILQDIARERSQVDAKTAKLRALRLAREEEERIAAENAPKPKPKTKAAPRVAKPRAAKAVTAKSG